MRITVALEHLSKKGDYLKVGSSGAPERSALNLNDLLLPPISQRSVVFDAYYTFFFLPEGIHQTKSESKLRLRFAQCSGGVQMSKINVKIL